MLKSQKSKLTCSYCSKIYKDPIELPCDDSICLEHLSEKEVCKNNRIKCKKCNEEFGVKNNEFKSNQTLKKLVEDQTHLSDEEISMKQKLEDSVQKFFEFYDEFVQNKNKIDSDVYDHFQEIRFQVDEQREELKKRIDDIALELIYQIKECEESFLENLKESFSSFDDSKSLANELKVIEETFRNPNLLIQTIKQMQSTQEDYLRDIQLELNEMKQFGGKDNLEADCDFKPNLSLFDQKEETSSFGSIQLYGFWLNANSFNFILDAPNYFGSNLFKSQILTGERQMSELIDLCEFAPNDKWSLLYRGTRDGFGAKAFHSKCDGHSNTLTIVKAKQSSYIFGGFTSVDWESCREPGELKSDANAFIFSLTNKDNKPIKMKVDPNQQQYAIRCYEGYGPVFGRDIIIDNNANTNMGSCSNLGDCYKHPQYEFLGIEAQKFLAGSYHFQLGEIEVFQKRIEK
jgi:hypothetical protein